MLIKVSRGQFEATMDEGGIWKSERTIDAIFVKHLNAVAPLYELTGYYEDSIAHAMARLAKKKMPDIKIEIVETGLADLSVSGRVY